MSKKGRSEITVICRTVEEEFVMTVLTIYLQSAYRALKKKGKVKRFDRIIMKAKWEYQKRQDNIPPESRPDVIW